MSFVLDLVASQPHYADHLLPIWQALPENIKGNAFLGEEVRRRAKSIADVALVAGYADIQLTAVQKRKYIYVEHGAGQSYVGLDRGADAFYSGGAGHKPCIAFICPNDEVADRWRSRYPNKPAFVVGSPRLDPWHKGDRGQVEPRTVAVTFHWDAQFTGIPETTSAFGDYFHNLRDAIVRWRSEGWAVLGHHHPRYEALASFWNEPEIKLAGVEPTPNANDVLDRASVLIADNTSLQADFLSLGRRVVYLNRPHDPPRSLGYRKHVEHGGRFWKWPNLTGQTIDTPASLVHLELDQVPAATWHPYAFADGHAAERAARAIVSLMRG